MPDQTRSDQTQAEQTRRDEPALGLIQELAQYGLSRVGPHGPIDSLGVSRERLPSWDDIQILTAQLARLPLLEDRPVGLDVVIGKRAKKPLRLEMPLLIADMAFGSMSEESKVALARGAELAGTAICSGESGLLPEEQSACQRYIVQMGSSRWGFTMESLKLAQAFHIKLGQAAKTGTGGHLVGSKVKGRVAQVHGAPEGTTIVAHARFPDWHQESDIRAFVDEAREFSGGIPIGFKMSAQHIEEDIEVAARLGVDYIILDGRGGATAAAPILFRDHIGVPTLPALARARHKLDQLGRDDISLVITGGLRTAPDFIKALALGADAIAIASSAIQAIGCTGIRACHTDTCPVGIATQDPVLRAKLDVDRAAAQLRRYLMATATLMQTMARACGHDHVSKFAPADLTTWKREITDLTGVSYGGLSRC